MFDKNYPLLNIRGGLAKFFRVRPLALDRFFCISKSADLPPEIVDLYSIPEEISVVFTATGTVVALLGNTTYEAGIVRLGIVWVCMKLFVNTAFTG